MQINSSIPNLIGGVSQQPELLRLPSHVRGQLNASSSPARGLSKRPPSVHMGSLPAYPSGTFGNVSIQDFGARGLYVFNIRPHTGVLEAWRPDGSSVPLYDRYGAALTTGTSYLATMVPHLTVRLVKEADTLFLVNTEKVVGSTTSPAELTTWPSLLWVKAGNYGRTYKITFGALSAWYRTPDGGAPSHSTLTTTDFIAEKLHAMLQGGTPGTGDGGSAWGTSFPAGAHPTAVRRGSVITIPTGNAEAVTEDGAGGVALTYIYRSVRSVAELPSRNLPDGFQIKIEGGDASAAGDHYLKFFAYDNTFKEVRAPHEVKTYLDQATLPMTLVPYLSGFQLGSPAWAGRLAGDSESNPLPQFVGQTINDLFFFQDRLGLVSGEGFSLSETGEYYNFFRTTTLDLLDSDPVTVTVNHPKISTLRHAVPFNKRLLFFSDAAQFELTFGDFLSPKNAGSALVTEYASSPYVRPVGIGGSLYFPVDRGGNTAYFNYFVGGVEAQDTAVEITHHVDRYIPQGVRHLVASPVTNMLFSVGVANSGYIYVHQFFQDGQQRIQSAWHRWQVGQDVLALMVRGDMLWLVTSRKTTYCVEQINLSSTTGIVTRLDRLLHYTPSAFQVFPSGSTHIALPYEHASGQQYWALVLETVPGSSRVKGEAIKLARMTDTASTLFTNADLTGCHLHVGLEYEMRADLGRFILREEAGGGVAGVSRGRTQVARMWVNYDNAAQFDVRVEVAGREPRLYSMVGRAVGTSGSIGSGGYPDYSMGRFSVPCMSENTNLSVSLINAAPTPSSFLSIDWEGYHVSRGQNV